MHYNFWKDIQKLKWVFVVLNVCKEKWCRVFRWYHAWTSCLKNPPIMKSHFLLSSSQSEIVSRIFRSSWAKSFHLSSTQNLTLLLLVKSQMPKICRDYSAQSPRIRDCIDLDFSFDWENKFDSPRIFCMHEEKT